MKAASVLIIVLVVASLAYLSVARIPHGSVGVADDGGAIRVLEAGFHLRFPFSARPVIYPHELPASSGEVEITTTDGVTGAVPFRSAARLDLAQAATFHRSVSGRGPADFIREASVRALREVAAGRPAADLASGALEQAASQTAGAILAPAGVSEILLKIGPLSPVTLLKLAQALAPQRKAGLLKGPVSEALSSGGGWEALTAMGLVLESEKDLRGAEKQYLDALTMNPTALPPMAQLVAIYAAVGEYEKMDRLLGTALEADRASVQHLNWLAVSYMKQDRLSDAEGILKRALDLEPSNTLLLNNLGGVQLKDGRLAEAAGSFRKAVTASPRDRQSLYNLGVALCAQGNFDEGIEHLLQAEREGFSGAALYRAIALAYQNLGRTAKAAEYERRAAAPGGVSR